MFEITCVQTAYIGPDKWYLANARKTLRSLYGMSHYFCVFGRSGTLTSHSVHSTLTTLIFVYSKISRNNLF